MFRWKGFNECFICTCKRRKEICRQYMCRLLQLFNLHTRTYKVQVKINDSFWKLDNCIRKFNLDVEIGNSVSPLKVIWKILRRYWSVTYPKFFGQTSFYGHRRIKNLYETKIQVGLFHHFNMIIWNICTSELIFPQSRSLRQIFFFKTNFTLQRSK